MKYNDKSIWRSMSTLLLTVSATSACVHGSTPPPVNSYCAVAQPIRYNSKLDSPDTVKQIEAHNSRYVCLCENDCPSGASSHQPAD